MKILRFCLLVTLSLSFAACGKIVPIEAGDGGTNGGNGDGGNGEDPDAAVKGLCEAPIAFADLTGCLVEAQCAQFVRCLPIFKDIDECTQFLPDVFGDFTQQFVTFGNAIDAGKINYDGDAAAACLAGFATLSCDSDGPQEQCEAVFRGTTSPGGECIEESECAELGSRCERPDCDFDAECCQGFCQSPADIGESCQSVSCKPGDKCVDADGTNEFTCQSGDAGSPCERNFDCDFNFFCDPDQGACVPALASGASCGASSQCSGDQECVGGICSDVDTLGAVCAGVCLGQLTCLNGQCVPFPEEGGACGAFSQCNSITLECVGDADTAVCSQKLGVGEDCGQRQCMPALFCENELSAPPPNVTCVEPLADGELCSRNRHCASNSCQFNAQTNQSFCQQPVDCYAE